MEGVAVGVGLKSPHDTVGEIDMVAIFCNVAVDLMVNDINLSSAAEADGKRARGQTFDKRSGQRLVERR